MMYQRLLSLSAALVEHHALDFVVRLHTGFPLRSLGGDEQIGDGVSRE